MKSMINILIAAFAFVIAFGIAILTGNNLVKHAVLLAFVINWIAYVPAYLLQTEKFYDLTGTITYLTVIWTTYVLSSSKLSSIPVGNLILVLLISFWAARLGSFLFMRIHKDGEDKRFRTIKTSASQFFMTWTLQGLWVSMCSMCAIAAIAGVGIIINAFSIIGIVIFLLGFVIEIVADQQKSQFRSIPENKDKFITSGLWSKSRHPNYFGEILLWFGVAIISMPALIEAVRIGEYLPIVFITLISPLFTYILLVYVSGVRMLEARGDIKWANDEAYKTYKKETPMLFPKL